MPEELKDETVQAEAELLLPDVSDVDHELVDNAVEQIKVLFFRNFTTAMIEIGEYLIKEFFDGDHELAKQKKSAKGKSFLQVINNLRVNGENNPSKSWLYNAINLVVDSTLLMDFHSYGNLPLSSKVMLLRVKDESLKRELVVKAVDESLSVSQLGEIINQSKNAQDISILRFLKNEKSVSEGNEEDIISKLPKKKLSKAKEIIEGKIKELEGIIEAKSLILDRYKEMSGKIKVSSSKGTRKSK